jgi:hypothetical protein
VLLIQPDAAVIRTTVLQSIGHLFDRQGCVIRRTWKEAGNTTHKLVSFFVHRFAKDNTLSIKLEAGF